MDDFLPKDYADQDGAGNSNKRPTDISLQSLFREQAYATAFLGVVLTLCFLVLFAVLENLQETKEALVLITSTWGQFLQMMPPTGSFWLNVSISWVSLLVFFWSYRCILFAGSRIGAHRSIYWAGSLALCAWVFSSFSFFFIDSDYVAYPQGGSFPEIFAATAISFVAWLIVIPRFNDCFKGRPTIPAWIALALQFFTGAPYLFQVLVS